MKNKMLAIAAVLVLVAGGALGIYKWMSAPEENSSAYNYLAVKYAEGDEYWSIIDKNGKVVVKSDFELTNTIISPISKNGAFWVYDNKSFKLYSVNSPKKPLTKVEYDGVTMFYNGVAFAAKEGEPIHLINEKGQVVKKLRKDIVKAEAFSDGLAVVRNREDLHGYVNTKGEFVIEPQYQDARKHHGGYMMVRKDEDGPICLIDKTGKEIDSFENGKYSLISLSDDGMIALVPKDKETKCRLMSVDGKIDFKTKTHYNNMFQMAGGYIVVWGNIILGTEKTTPHYRSALIPEMGVINYQDETILRMGKYKQIFSIGDGTFVVERNDKYGVVDQDDNVIVDFDYTEIADTKLGSNYIARQGDTYLLIDAQGKEVKNSEFKRFITNPELGYSNVMLKE